MTAETSNTFLTKKTIDRWFTDNQKDLTIVIKGMAAKNNKLNQWADLFSNTYIYVLGIPHKNELDLRRTAINYAKMQLEWNNTYLSYELKDSKTTEMEEGFDVEDCYDDTEEKLEAEYEYQLKMAAIYEYRQSLTKLEDIVLFDIYFSGDNTRDKLVKRFKKQNKKMGSTTATRMLRTFRANITAIYVKNGGTLGVFPNKIRKK